MASIRRAARLVCITSIVLVWSVPAAAQYAWIGDNGVRQYSDRPPPASVPASRILKMPKGAAAVTPAVPPSGVSAAAAGASAGEAVSSTAAKAASVAPGGETIAQQNAAFEKRRKEAAEKEKKAAEENRVATETAKRCEDARSYQKTLQSGGRIARTNKNGERYFLNDADRAKEAADVAKVIADCK